MIMQLMTVVALLGALFASAAFAKDYPNGSGTADPGTVVICSTGVQAGSGPCGTTTQPLVTTPGAPTAASSLTPVKSSAAETGHILKGAPGALVSVTVTLGAAAGYVMVHDAATVPSAGAVTPVYCWQVPANGTLALGWSVGANFATGISASFSTTGCFTQTNSATAFFSAQVN